jgi:hypothetical protein
MFALTQVVINPDRSGLNAIFDLSDGDALKLGFGSKTRGTDGRTEEAAWIIQNTPEPRWLHLARGQRT